MSNIDNNALVNVFKYEGNNVTFKTESGVVFVNLTEVARAFPKKNLTQIVNSKEISEYTNELSKIIKSRFVDLQQITKNDNSTTITNVLTEDLQEVTELQIYSSVDNQLVTTMRGGNKKGETWAHELVAMRICQKLSPKFSIWVDERIRELIINGITALPTTIDNIIANPDLGIELLTSLKEERTKRMELQEKLGISEGRLNNAKIWYINNEVKRKLKHYDELMEVLSKIPLHQKTVTDIIPILEGDDFLKVTPKIRKTSQGIKNTSMESINTKDCILVSDIPQFLNLPFGRNNFYRELRENGVFMKKKNFPKSKFISKGFFIEEKTKVFVTPIGVNFVNHLFNEECQN